MRDSPSSGCRRVTHVKRHLRENARRGRGLGLINLFRGAAFGFRCRHFGGSALGELVGKVLTVFHADMLLLFSLGLFAFSEAIQVTPEPQPLDFPTGYRNYVEMTKFLSGLARDFPDFASVSSIGQSIEGRELWVLKIKAPNSPVIGAPHVKFVGNIHGNEPVGRELILRFAEYLLKTYEKDAEVKWILDRTIVYLLPSLNPDGFERSREGACHSGPGRENGNFVDLNRSFPDYFKENFIPLQPESLAVVRWMSQVPFILSASFHGGALVANYPFDSTPLNDSEALLEEIRSNLTRGANLLDIWTNLTPNERGLLSPHPSLTPDDDVFRHLAQTYANGHLTMHKGRTCSDSQSFPGGITNGAAWYSFTGGMQDYNYVSQGCMELTLEISCCKYPQAEHLPRLWAENKRAMLDLAKQSQIGVRGLILDKKTSAPISGAILRISGRSVPFTSSKNGEFWRMLLPGNYTLIVEASAYESQSFPFKVEIGDVNRPTSTWLNVYLQPAFDLLGSASLNMVELTKNSSGSPSGSLLVSVCFPLLFGFFSS